jgi:hypothetical protein
MINVNQYGGRFNSYASFPLKRPCIGAGQINLVKDAGIKVLLKPFFCSKTIKVHLLYLRPLPFYSSSLSPTTV